MGTCGIDTPPAIAPIVYGDDLRRRVADHLGRHRRAEVPLDGRKHAAVVVVLVDSAEGSDLEDAHAPDVERLSVIPSDVTGLDGRMAGVAGGASFVLCRRSSRLNAHAGQWALPGGRLDPGEDAIAAALRETHEEIGLDLPGSAVLGLLDDYPTRSGYVITPVVVWAGADAVMDPNPDEVMAAYRIGLHQLCRADSPRFVTIPESDRPVVQLPIGGDMIHAPTAAPLVQFRWVALDGLASDDARVAHFEQPVFAWG